MRILIRALLSALLLFGLTAAPAGAAGYKHEAPTDLRAEVVTDRAVDTFWACTPGALRYRIQYSTRKDMRKAKYNWSPRGGACEEYLTNLSSGKTYYIKVRVIDNKGRNLSPYSKAISIRVPKAGELDQ